MKLYFLPFLIILNFATTLSSLGQTNLVTDEESKLSKFLKKQKRNIRGFGGFDLYYFYEEFEPEVDKNDLSTSFVFDATYSTYLKNRKYKIIFQPYFRGDLSDESRTHFDIRNLLISYRGKSIEANFGIQSVSWGFAQGISAINIANQSDEKEGVINAAKLGQPMAELVYFKPKWSVKGYIMPFFRKKNYPDYDSRFYLFPLPVGEETIEDQEFPDFALRYFRTFGKLDGAITYFNGINRDPQLGFNPFTMKLDLNYRKIQQSSLELQYVYKDFLPRAEVFIRNEGSEYYYGFLAGTEISFSNILKKGINIILFSEYYYDEWKEHYNFPLSENISTGLNVTFSDVHSTALNVKAITEPKDWINLVNIELSRKVVDNLETKISYTKYFGKSLRLTDPLYVLQYMDNLNLTCNFYF